MFHRPLGKIPITTDDIQHFENYVKVKTAREQYVPSVFGRRLPGREPNAFPERKTRLRPRDENK
jgi:hypothetical protein